jgi:hypothetical protein
LSNDAQALALGTLKTAVKRSAKASAADSRAAWLARVRKMTARQRVPVIERALRTLPKTPTASNVFFRKQLLRLRDESRLEAGMVSATELQRENSPFTEMGFRSARINFRPRVQR